MFYSILKPVVQLPGAFCKAEQSGHVKRNGRQNRDHHAGGTQSQAHKAQHDPEQFEWIFHHLLPVFISILVVQLLAFANTHVIK